MAERGNVEHARPKQPRMRDPELLSSEVYVDAVDDTSYEERQCSKESKGSKSRRISESSSSARQAPRVTVPEVADPSARAILTWLDAEIANRLESIESKIDSFTRGAKWTQMPGPPAPVPVPQEVRRVSIRNQALTFGPLGRPHHRRSSWRPSYYPANPAFEQPQGDPDPSIYFSQSTATTQDEDAGLRETGRIAAASDLSDVHEESRNGDGGDDFEADETAAVSFPEEDESSDEPNGQHVHRVRSAAFKIPNKQIQQNSRLSQLLNFQDQIAYRSKHRSKWADMVWHFFEEPESSTAATYYSYAMPILIMAGVILTLLQTGSPPLITGVVPAVFELTLDILYALEFIARAITSPNRSRFLFSMYNLVDFTALITIALRISVGFVMVDSPMSDNYDFFYRFQCYILLCCVPVVRLLKLLRRFEKFHLLYHAFENALEALPVLLFTGAIILLCASTVIFFFEPRWNIDCYPRAMWLALVTMTTVGYGDVAPKSTLGTLGTSILVIASALYMSIPLGIVGNAFNRVWEDRERLLLMQRTRKRLAQWGYTATDITTFFKLYSMSGDGILTFPDFSRMITEMRLGLSTKRVIDLFLMFDDDESGTIEPDEFVSILYPNATIEDDDEEEINVDTPPPQRQSRETSRETRAGLRRTFEASMHFGRPTTGARVLGSQTDD